MRNCNYRLFNISSNRSNYHNSNFICKKHSGETKTMKVKIDMRTLEVISVEFDTEVQEDIKHMNSVFKNKDGVCLTTQIVDKIKKNGVRA